MRRSLRLILILALVVGQLALPATMAAQPSTPVTSEAQFAPDQLLIQFKAGVGPAEKARARNVAGAQPVEVIRASAHGDLELATLPPGFAVATAVGALQRHPAVAFAEPNWVFTHQATSNDPHYTGGNLWGMYGDATTPSNQYGSQAGEAWAAGNTGSSTVYVGVIDEGYQFAHADLSANAWLNPFDLPDGVDNDRNGYVDDVRGWDFYSKDNTVYDGTGDDHGTHVAGTIGAHGGNSIGVAGVAWDVRLISGKFLGPNGGYLADAVKAVDYFTDLKTRHGLNVVATNNSWGGGGYSQALHDAINRAAKANILFVAAAGNGNRGGKAQNNDSTASYPSNYDTSVGTSTESGAGYDAVIAVAAIDSSGRKASWSNYGATTVDLGAPGVSISSTLPDGTYGSYSGTSMATPHVTGGAALYAAANPGASAAQVKSAILSGTVPTSSLDGITVTGGRLNVSGFVSGDTVTPPPDTTAPDTTIVNKPAALTNSTSASFTYTSTESGSTFACQLDTLGWTSCPTTGVSYTSLSNGSHTFQVRATDAASNTDDSPATYTWTIDTIAPDSTITAQPSDPSSSSSASFSFSASESGSTFACSLDSALFSACTSPQEYTSLANGEHTFQVRATDAAGNTGSPASHTWTVEVSSSLPAPVITVASITPNQVAAGGSVSVTIAGTGFASGATVAFENGSGPSPSATVTSVSSDGTTITATVTAPSGGPPRSRVWDVRITNPDTSTAALPQSFTVTR